MLYIGNQTSCGAATPIEPFDYALQRQFDAFEWFPDKKPEAGWDESDLDRHARQTISESACARSMRLSVHARWQANPLTPDGYALIWKDLELARDLRAALFNIHLFHEQGLRAFVEAILPLVRRTREAGMQLAIENTPHHTPEQFNELFARLRALDSVETGHVGMCLDLGHANLCPATLNDYLKYCDRLDPRLPIIHLHLHENWGDADSHLTLFTGPASQNDSGIRGLVSRLRQRNFSGSAIFEQWPQPPLLLEQARDRLLELWGSSGGEAAHNAGSTPAAPKEKATLPVLGDGLASELVAGDRGARSWREKLDFVRGLLAGEDRALRSDDLIDVAIYLRFLGTGEISCAEDGGHFRPAHHARTAWQIQERLAGLTTHDNECVVRKIYPWLPSSAPTFQRPEPLTRIRDIAHRNDISQDLKREIKTTLQNKLHRCAGPEDLATSAALLERITAPGANFSPAFVEQFKLFHAELKEFFNAQSLDERLETLQRSVDPKQAELIRLFLRQKTGAAPPGQMAALRVLTTLRHNFLEIVAQERRGGAQELLLADIAMEDFAFVLLSEIINGCEALPTDSALRFETDALVVALNNLALSGYEREESRSVASELEEWSRSSASALRDDLLRLKASALRGRRLAEAIAERTVALFSARAKKLGRALGVAQHAIRVFSESDLRGQIVFQVSKLASGLLHRIRTRLGSPAWDVLVGGRALGRLVSVASLEGLNLNSREPVIVLSQSAAGDEEIPGHVAGIVLTHELPHLSHLGVRARQAGVVFVTCEDATEYEGMRKLEGQMVALMAVPDAVTWESLKALPAVAARAQPPAPRIPAVRLPPEGPWIPLERASIETGGSKAAGTGRLAELSRREDAGFHTARSLVVPFGVMEAALAAAPGVQAEYRELVKRLGDLPFTEFLSATERLRQLVQKLPVPDAITSGVAREFAPNTALIVRSSANCEDLEEFAGAGLYESVINVSPGDVASAVRKVWSSLWTQRAASSRQDAHIPHEQAHMAVLIQELIDPDLAFVLHTVNPLSHNVREVYAEIVVGLGETLVSAATRGSPYRLVCDKDSGAVDTLAFANFSQASRPDAGGGLRREIVDYSRVDLSRDAGARARLGRRFAAIGSLVERAFGKPQDLEGSVVKDRIYLVQARPQQGLAVGKR